jgi:hypothetical protein
MPSLTSPLSPAQDSLIYTTEVLCTLLNIVPASSTHLLFRLHKKLKLPVLGLIVHGIVFTKRILQVRFPARNASLPRLPRSIIARCRRRCRCR